MKPLLLDWLLLALSLNVVVEPKHEDWLCPREAIWDPNKLWTILSDVPLDTFRGRIGGVPTTSLPPLVYGVATVERTKCGATDVNDLLRPCPGPTGPTLDIFTN